LKRKKELYREPGKGGNIILKNKVVTLIVIIFAIIFNQANADIPKIELPLDE